MVYLNNAATTYPKPPAVLQAWREALERVPAQAFRSTGGTRYSSETMAVGSPTADVDPLTTCRHLLAQIIGTAHPERIYFTSGATAALNLLLLGLDHLTLLPIVATQTEHNSVLRPLYNLPHLGASGRPPIILPCNQAGQLLMDQAQQCLERLEQKWLLAERTNDTTGSTNDTKACGQVGNTTQQPGKPPYSALLIVNHCSNVTGAIQDIPTLAQLAHRHHALILVDAAQSAGCIPIWCDDWDIDLLAFTGHKSLLGPQGTGGYYVRPDLTLRPAFYGGTGHDSRRLTYGGGDYEYEVGTQNLPGIAALAAGARYVLDRGIDRIVVHEQQLMHTLRQGLAGLPRVKVYGPDGPDQGPVVSLSVEGITPYDLGFILHNVYGITTRTGLHCSPLIHQAMGTYPQGTVRVSIQDLTTPADIQAFLQAMSDIAGPSAL